MPATERGPEPRPEAEQHGLGLVVEGVAEGDAGALVGGRRPQGRVAGGAGGRLGAAVPADLDPDDGHRVEPEVAQQVAPCRSARGREPACSPWSTVTAPAGTPARGASKATAAASARESAPPLQATRTGWSEAVSAGRTALRTCATAGSGPATAGLRR